MFLSTIIATQHLVYPYDHFEAYWTTHMSKSAQTLEILAHYVSLELSG